MKPDLILTSDNSNRYLTAFSKSKKEKSPRAGLITAAALIITFASLISYGKRYRTLVQDKANVQLKKMIIVFPFENSGYNEYEYLSQFMSNEISIIPDAFGDIDLNSKSGSGKNAGSNNSLNRTLKESIVAYYPGSISRLNKSKGKPYAFRLIRRLLGISDDLDIWSGSYIWIPDDVFAERCEIVRSVVNKLIIRKPLTQFTTGPPSVTGIHANDYYLKKSPSFRQNASSGYDISSCVKFFEKTIEPDSDFAIYAGYAFTYSGIFSLCNDGDISNPIKTHQHINKTAELDPETADIQPLRGIITIGSLRAVYKLKRIIKRYKKVNKIMICNIFEYLQKYC